MIREQFIKDWMKNTIFVLGHAWATEYKDRWICGLEELSSYLRLRWVYSSNMPVVRIETLPEDEKHNYWLGSYINRGHDPFEFCFRRGERLDDSFVEKVEKIILSYLPKISLTRCQICESPFVADTLDGYWICKDCFKIVSQISGDKSGFVYIFGSNTDGYFKIGASNRPIGRMQDHERVRLPFRVEMIHQIPVDDKLKAEAELHRFFRMKQTRGEWFKLDSSELDKIISIKGYVSGHWIRN